MQTRKWQDQYGSDRYSTEVVLQGFGGTLTMLDCRNNSNEEFNKSPDTFTPNSNENSLSANTNDIDDEIPF